MTRQGERGKEREIKKIMFSVLNDSADTSVFIAAVSPKEEELNVRAKATRRCNRPDNYNRLVVRDGVSGMRSFFNTLLQVKCR